MFSNQTLLVIVIILSSALLVKAGLAYGGGYSSDDFEIGAPL
jgi:hypothetical protein